MSEEQGAVKDEAQPSSPADVEKPGAPASPPVTPVTEGAPAGVKEPEAPSATAGTPKATGETTPAPTPRTKTKKKAKKVTAKVLRAAARTTADIKDIVAAEVRSKGKIDGEQSSVFARAQEMQESGQGRVDLPVTASPADARPDRSHPATRPVQTPSPPPRAAEAGPAQPPPSSHTHPAARERRLPPPPPPSPAPPGPASPGPLIGLALAVLAAGALVAWSLHDQSQALRALAERSAEPTPIRLVPSELPPPSTPGEGAGALAEVGAGRVVYADSSGRLVILRRDPTSAELEVERVYELVHDEGRGQGRPGRRYHGYYLDDLETLRRDGIEAAHKRYEAAVTHAAQTYSDVDAADAAAVALVAAGGADRLVEHLGAESTALRRRTAVVGLAEGGYLCAVEPLLELLQDHVRNPKFFAYLVKLGGRLISRELDPSDPEAVFAAVRAWLARNTNKDPFARVKGA